MGELDGLRPVVVLHVDIGRHVLRLGQRQGQDVSAQRHIHARGVCIGIKALAVRARQDRLHGPVRIQCGIQRAGSGVPLKLRRGVYGADGQRPGHRDVIAREGDAQGRSGAGLGRSVLRVSVADDPLAVLILQHEIAVSDELRAFDFPAGDGQGRLTVTVEQVEPLALPYGQSGQRLGSSHGNRVGIGSAIAADGLQRHPVGASGDGFPSGQGQQIVFIGNTEPRIVHGDFFNGVAVAFHQSNVHTRSGRSIQTQRRSFQPGGIIPNGDQNCRGRHRQILCGRRDGAVAVRSRFHRHTALEIHFGDGSVGTAPQDVLYHFHALPVESLGSDREDHVPVQLRAVKNHCTVKQIFLREFCRQGQLRRLNGDDLNRNAGSSAQRVVLQRRSHIDPPGKCPRSEQAIFVHAAHGALIGGHGEDDTFVGYRLLAPQGQAHLLSRLQTDLGHLACGQG